jgi:chromosome segregation ATPase
MTAKNNDYPQTLMQELHNWRKERDLRLAAEHTLKCTLEECQNLKERLQQINDAYHAAEADVTIANARIRTLEAQVVELDSRIGHILDNTSESNNEDHLQA